MDSILRVLTLGNMKHKQEQDVVADFIILVASLCVCVGLVLGYALGSLTWKAKVLANGHATMDKDGTLIWKEVKD